MQIVEIALNKEQVQRIEGEFTNCPGTRAELSANAAAQTQIQQLSRNIIGNESY